MHAGNGKRSCESTDLDWLCRYRCHGIDLLCEHKSEASVITICVPLITWNSLINIYQAVIKRLLKVFLVIIKPLQDVQHIGIPLRKL